MRCRPIRRGRAATTHFPGGFVAYGSIFGNPKPPVDLILGSTIAATVKYYVTIDADAVADAVWRRDWEAGNTFGNNQPTKAPRTETAPADESTEAVENESLT